MQTQGKREWKMTAQQHNIYENLQSQAHKIFDWRTHHQGKRGTERYRNGVNAFCEHLAIKYRSKKFVNISDKHLETFAEFSQQANVSSRTIKTDLSAIRKLHAMLPKKQYKLRSDNKALGVERRKSVGIDRAWKNSEVTKAYRHTKVMNRQDVVWAMSCSRTLGLKIEETTALTKTQLREALINDYLHLTKTKGGILRDIPLNNRAERVLRDMLVYGKDERIFMTHGWLHT